MNPVTFKWKWGEEELLIVDQYTYLGAELSKYCSRDVHITKVIGKGKTHVRGTMDAILLITDSHLYTRIRILRMYYTECDCTQARIRRRRIGREREVRKTAGNSTDGSS